MKTIKSGKFDPFYNLALEEYLLKNPDINEDIFFVWRNKKCVILGRNQNLFNELDIEYATGNDIDIVRRSTGGGTVYHDMGNINFTFITSKITNRLHNYKYFLTPIISILRNLGINAKFVPKTHIFVGENKISGNAQTFYKNKMIHHGTLLFDVNKSHLQNVLKSKPLIETYAIPSQRSHVLNLKEILNVEMSITDLMDYILEQIGLTSEDVINLTVEQEMEISNLAKSKYQTWSWIYGQTPKFSIIKNEYRFDIVNCVITFCSHYEHILKGLKYDRLIISESLIDHKDKEHIVNLLFS